MKRDVFLHCTLYIIYFKHYFHKWKLKAVFIVKVKIPPPPNSFLFWNSGHPSTSSMRCTYKAGPRYVGAPGRLLIWRSLQRGWHTSLKARAQFTNNLRRNSFMFVNQHFWLFQWRLSIPYRMAPREAAGLVCPLVRPQVQVQGAAEKPDDF
jgi:hypothetical protein